MSHLEYTIRIRRTSQTKMLYVVEATISGNLATGAMLSGGPVLAQFSLDQTHLHAHFNAPETYIAVLSGL